MFPKRRELTCGWIGKKLDFKSKLRWRVVSNLSRDTLSVVMYNVEAQLRAGGLEIAMIG